jgi:phage-related minor tail protein
LGWRLGISKKAWDAMFDVGREQTLADKLATLNESIAEEQKGQKKVDSGMD